MTYHHPAIEQLRVMRTTRLEYGLPAPAPELPPLPPDELRQLLTHHPAPPQGSADAI